MQNKRRRGKAQLAAVPTPAANTAMRDATSNRRMLEQTARHNAAVVSFTMLDNAANISASQEVGQEETFERNLSRFPPAEGLEASSPLTRVIEAVIVWLAAAIAVAMLLGPLTNP